MDYRQHRLDYCQFLISSQINYTQTYMADHSERYSHDSMNCFLRLDKLTPRIVWENVRDDIVPSEQGYVLFDDVVLDKRHSNEARLVRRQWSGNEKRVIYGIGAVTCVYVNPETEQFWVIDFRVYDPEVVPEQTITWFVLRLRLEVTLQEVRAHLGVETQRQWSDLAIARTTPAPFGLFSLVTLAAHELYQEQVFRPRRDALLQDLADLLGRFG